MLDFLNQIFSIEALGHLAYTLIFFSFLVKRMLWLRIFMIVASVASIFYNFSIASEPLWTPIQWNVLFIATNLYHIVKIIMEMRAVTLNENEKLIHKNSLQNLSTRELKNIVNIGFTRTYEKGEVIIEENEVLDGLYVIVKGKVEILAQDSHITYLDQGKFVGEMSFLTNERTKAKVKVTEQSTIHIWPKEKLREYLSKNSELISAFHSCIGNQLINIIIMQNDVVKEHHKLKIAA